MGTRGLLKKISPTPPSVAPEMKPLHGTYGPVTGDASRLQGG